MLIRSRIGVGSIVLHRRRPTRGQRVLCPSPEICIHLFSFMVLGNSVSHLIEMSLLIS